MTAQIAGDDLMESGQMDPGHPSHCAHGRWTAAGGNVVDQWHLRHAGIDNGDGL
jgi:hypothetical protein